MRVLEILIDYGFIHDTSQVQGEKVKIVCPFHEEANASLNFDIHKEIFYCFGCNAKGRLVDFIMRLEECSKLVALRKLSVCKAGSFKYRHRQNYAKKYAKAKVFQRKQAKELFYMLSRVNWSDIGEHYMIDDRGFDRETLTHFDVRINSSSYYPIIMPIKERNYFKGYCMRMDAESEEMEEDNEYYSKYRYNKGFSRANCLAGCPDRGWPILVVEGLFDMMRAWQYDYANCIALLGWHATSIQLKKISGYGQEIICALDNDDRGEEGYELLSNELSMDVCRFEFPKRCKDICDMSMHQFNFEIRRTLNWLKNR